MLSIRLSMVGSTKLVRILGIPEHTALDAILGAARTGHPSLSLWASSFRPHAYVWRQSPTEVSNPRCIWSDSRARE